VKVEITAVVVTTIKETPAAFMKDFTGRRDVSLVAAFQTTTLFFVDPIRSVTIS
jgi:hypothetical protein